MRDKVVRMNLEKLQFAAVDMAMLRGGAELHIAKRATGKDVSRWEADRARHHPQGRPPKGLAGRSRAATQETNGETLRCMREGCGALVDRGRAYRDAIARYRTDTGLRWMHWRDGRYTWNQQPEWQYVTGDGCGSPLCSARHRPAVFYPRQIERAELLREGKRTLITWPDSVKDRHILKYDAATTERVCREVVARCTEERPPKRGR